MITITRSLARQLRAVFRRTGAGRYGRSIWITLLASSDVLRVRLKTDCVALEYCLAGQFQPEQLTVPFEFLADCEGRKDDPVTIEAHAKDRVLVNWSDRGVPQMVQYDAEPSDRAQDFPALPEGLQAIEPGIWPALAEAVQVADRSRIRYALDCLHLRGASGQVAATNGRHVLIHGGYSFPWPDDVLVPASTLLGCMELAASDGITIGKTDDWVTWVSGPWSVVLKIEKEARFPSVDDNFRAADRACTRLHLDASDAQFLATALPRLPGGEGMYCPVTLDLNGRVVVRAADEERTNIAELTLSNSHSSGEPIIVNTNRNFLLRAAQLGFREICLFGLEMPIQCEDGHRR